MVLAPILIYTNRHLVGDVVNAILLHIFLVSNLDFKFVFDQLRTSAKSSESPLCGCLVDRQACKSLRYRGTMDSTCLEITHTTTTRYNMLSTYPVI